MIPLTSSEEEDYNHESEYESVMFLSEADPDCFCDELCVQYGDCCSDYTYVCPRKQKITTSIKKLIPI